MAHEPLGGVASELPATDNKKPLVRKNFHYLQQDISAVSIFPGLPARSAGRIIELDELQETAMRAFPIKRFVSWLFHVPAIAAAPISRTKSATPLVEFDPFWHGDHWQNLLASPMDARHYVMEDWALPLENDEVNDHAAHEKPGSTRRHMR